MSHRLDSPIARQDIRLNITDLYLFRGGTGTAFVIDVCHSIFGPIPTPGYHPEGMYEFKVDLNGDAIEDVTYRLTFSERDSHGNQSYVVRCIRGADAVNPHSPGVVVAEGTTGETVVTPSGVRAWAGKAGDPFWIEPDVLHAVGHAFQDGTTINLAGWDLGRARNLFAGHTVYSIVLEVPDSELLAGTSGNRHAGVWAVATLATDAGGWRSINRVGLPMIPLFSPNITKISAIALMPVARSTISLPTARPSSKRSPAWWRQTELRKTPAPAPKRSRIGSSEYLALRGRHAGDLRSYRMERPLAHRQRAGCHVLDCGQCPGSPRDREGVSDLETDDDLPVRSCCVRGAVVFSRCVRPVSTDQAKGFMTEANEPLNWFVLRVWSLLKRPGNI